jgi:5-formyltetrahydrofolate cyclo-ligase
MEILKRKKEIRRLLRIRRDTETDREPKSVKIAACVREQPWYASASSVCCYVSIDSEVGTHALIDQALAESKQVSVPWCDGNQLRLAGILSRDELAPGTIGLLEPVVSVRADPLREVLPGSVGLFLVPGLGFSLAGERIGYGKGYYDRLLADVKTGIKTGIKCGLAFQCQILEDLPTHEFDVRMHFIVTEAGLVYRGDFLKAVEP